MIKKIHRWLPLLVLIGLLVLFFSLHLDKYLSFNALRENHALLIAWTQTHYFIAPLIFYCFLYHCCSHLYSRSSSSYFNWRIFIRSILGRVICSHQRYAWGHHTVFCRSHCFGRLVCPKGIWMDRAYASGISA